MGIGFRELLIILAIALVLFGAKKLKNIGSDLGGAVKGFKDGVRDGGASSDAAPPPQQVTSSKSTDANTVDVEAKTKS